MKPKARNTYLLDSLFGLFTFWTNFLLFSAFRLHFLVDVNAPSMILGNEKLE